MRRRVWWIFLGIFVVAVILMVRWFWPGERLKPKQDQEQLRAGEVVGVSLHQNDDVFLPSISPSGISVPTQPIAATPSPAVVQFITPIPTPTPAPIIGLQNADFSAGLQHWQTRGAVQVFPLLETEHHNLPSTTKHFVRLASAQNLEWLGAHALEQTFTVPDHHTSLGFWYRLRTEETELGFDSPSFVAFINQQPVAWFSASEAIEAWQHFVVPLPPIAQTITISFMAGQTGDQTKATWVDVTNITTGEAELTQTTPEFPTDLRMQLTSLNNGSLGLSAISEQLPSPEHMSNQPLIQELLMPELAQHYALQPQSWRPDGTTFQPSLTSPEFHLTSASYITENFSNLIVQLEQLKTLNPTNPSKLWLTIKTALNQVIQLVPVDY